MLATNPISRQVKLGTPNWAGRLLLLACLLAATRGWLLAGDAVAEAEARLGQSAQYLASDELEGRGIGTRGLDLAASYIAEQFAAAGLKTELFEGAPFQKFKMAVSAKLGEHNELVFVGPAPKEGEGETIDLKMGRDFTPLALGGSGKFDLPLVFVGYGITAPDDHYDDYAGIDVTGKAVIVLRHEPQQNNPHGKFEGTNHSSHAALSRKVSNAYEHGAAAVVFCSSERGVLKDLETERQQLDQVAKQIAEAREAFGRTDDPTLEQIERHRRDLSALADDLRAKSEALAKETDELVNFRRSGQGEQGRDFPVLHVRRVAVDRLLRDAVGLDLSAIERQIDDGPTPHSLDLPGWRARGEVSVLREETDVKNVVGVLEGTGPHADETIVIGAHYDHLGRGGEGSLALTSTEIHNGADDNGSGTAVLLEVARRLAGRGEKLGRRVVFIAFTGEERGLIGSARYVREPLIPLERTVAMLNMDMVGRLKDNKLIIYGTGTADLLNELVDRFNQQPQFEITKHASGFGPSDQSSFYAKNIPVLHFFTGTHADYHRPSDDFDKLNVAGMNQVAAYVSEIAAALANGDEKPAYKPTGADRTAGGGGGDRPYFGSIPDFSQDQPGYALSGVTKDGPAEKAGLKPGDILIQLGDSKIGNLEDFDSALRKHKAGDKVPVVVKRAGQDVRLEVILAAPR